MKKKNHSKFYKIEKIVKAKKIAKNTKHWKNVQKCSKIKNKTLKNKFKLHIFEWTTNLWNIILKSETNV